MERILVVDDNKALAKLIVMQMEKTIDEMAIDVAYSFAEAQMLINEHDKDYFMTILDLNLPDAPNGEIVDYALSKGLCAIVLTGSIDDQTRQNFINKDIVDYVYKGNMDDINYIFQMINRLSKNRQYKVLVVEDSLPFRNMIKKILTSLQFKVLAAAHGEEAMNYFADNPDINLIITDYRMPVKDGLEVLKEVRKEKDKNHLGVIVMTSPSEKTDAAIFLKNGASDFIAKPFSKEDIAKSLQEIIVNVLYDKILMAVKEKDVKTILVAGGVSANRRLREKFSEFTQTIIHGRPDMQLKELINFFVGELLRYKHFHGFVTQEMQHDESTRDLLTDFYIIAVNIIERIIERGISIGLFTKAIKAEDLLSTLIGTVLFTIRNKGFYAKFLNCHTRDLPYNIEEKVKSHLINCTFALLGYDERL